LQILEKNNKWLTARQIQQEAKHISIGSIRSNLQKLSKHKIVEIKPCIGLTITQHKHQVNKYRVKKNE
jgi:Fe2+ or Zn2+ uptake regulation protein